MNGKFAILLVLAAAAQSSLAQNASESCLNSTSSIKSDLAIIEYGQATALDALEKMATAINNEIMFILTNRRGKGSPKKHVPSGNDDARLELAKEEAVRQMLRGMVPTMKAIKVFQPELDVEAIMARRSVIVEEFVGGIFSAINVTRMARRHSAARGEVAGYMNPSIAIGSTLVRGLFDALLNGTSSVPESSEARLACVAAKAEYHILSAIKGIAEQINILLDATFDVGAKDARQRIAAAFQKTLSSYEREILTKFTAIRNVAVGAYLQNSTDIVTGLFDILSTVTGYTDI